MLQYLLTALAGAGIAIVVMRLWQSREGDGPGQTAETASPSDEGTGARLPRPWLLGAGGLVVVAALVFAFRGSETSPGLSSGPAPSSAPGQQQLADVDTMIARLAERLAKNPNDGEGFRMLGWSYLMTGHPDKAIEPYKRALALLPGNAGVHAGYGEAMVGVAKGKVTDQAHGEFVKAVALDPAEPRARYFLAMWDAQNGRERQALDKWVALANSGPADAPWQADVRRQVEATGRKLGVDAVSRLKTAPTNASTGELDPAAIQAAQAMAPQDRQTMINGMVDGLAERLKTNPADADGWIKLLRSRMVLGQSEQAGRDLVIARKGLGTDKAAIGRVEAAARQLGVPGA